MIKKIIHYFPRFLSIFFHFNPIIAIKIFAYPVICHKKSLYDQNAHKHKLIKQYLKKRYKKTIESFKGRTSETGPSFTDDYPIWYLWWQGETHMPPVVKTCYLTLKFYSNGHKVNLITKDNYRDFVSIPDFIIKKVEKKVFSLTLFSDILRICFLYEHGGLWLDSTVLLTKPLPPLPEICSRLGFWSPRDDGEIITVCFGAKNWIIREGKWLAFCLYSGKHNILVEFVRALFFTYIKTNNALIDYFIIDYFISIAYDTLPEIRTMIDSVPENNPKVHEIYHRLNLNNEYSKFLFDDICVNTVFHKLNWKEEHQQYTENGKLTNYGYIMDNYPPNIYNFTKECQ
jgi:hypothetical protein